MDDGTREAGAQPSYLAGLAGHPATVAVGLFALFFVLRLPFVSDYLVNWDAVNFALGVEEFSLQHHQPHPPGYPGFILLGRAVSRLVGDGALGLTLLGLAGGALAPAGLFLFGRRIVGRRAALVSALLLGSSPLLWYYSEVALTYTLETALAIPVVLLSLTGRARRSQGRLIVAGLLLACLGAIRQTGVLLLLPALLYGIWGIPWRARLKVVGIAAAGTLVWLVPLLVTAGGIRAYMRLSSELAALTGGRTWVLSGNLTGFLGNMGFVALGTAAGLGAVLALVPRLLHRGMLPGRRIVLMTVLWGGPALAVYLLIHTGQLGYMLLPLPGAFLWAGQGLTRVSSGRKLWRTVTVLALANTAAFLLVPRAAYHLLSTAGPDNDTGRISGAPAGPDTAVMPGDIDMGSSVEAGARQFDIELNDTHWEAVLSFVREYDPDSTVVLANPTNWGSFRHIAYYLPEYRVYGLGFDRDGSFGHLFSAKDGRSDYEVERLSESSNNLRLPPEARTVVIPDATVAASLNCWQNLETTEMEDGSIGATARVAPGTAIHFSRQHAMPVVEPDLFVDPGGGVAPGALVANNGMRSGPLPGYGANHSGTGSRIYLANPAFSPI